eukprot:TRINITY_DN4860_c0_g1_i1.p1 TRINITY_DN4860_c0_g1~~TRINITY_DN4860_c0_g1_i1.p1  ORF type:complete len:195 (+),score=45.55 TRINITY_DN4860_c0_g1_i1:559-1143(+)
MLNSKASAHDKEVQGAGEKPPGLDYASEYSPYAVKLPQVYSKSRSCLAYRFASATRRPANSSNVVDVNSTPGYLDKALQEAAWDNCRGFINYEDHKSQLVKLNFPDPSMKVKQRDKYEDVRVEDKRDKEIEREEAPMENPLSLFLRDLKGNVVSKEKCIITPIKNNKMSLYGQYVMRSILKKGNLSFETIKGNY